MLNKIFLSLTLPRLLFICSILVVGAAYTLYDPDYYWHLKSGQYIFENGVIPRADIFSYTMAGKDWVLHEWLFQVIIYLIQHNFSESGLKLFSAFLIFLTTYIIFNFTKKQSSTPIATTLILVFYPLLLLPFLAPRPQLFSYLFFALFLHFLFREKYSHQKIPIILFPLTMMFWVNIHGGYIVGLALLLVYCVSEVISSWMKTGTATTSLKRHTHLYIIFFLTTLATGCNPDFYHHLLYPFQVISMDASRHIINEWQSPNFHDSLGQAYLAFTFLFFTTSIFNKNTPDCSELLLPLCFLSQGFLSIRHIPLALLITTPFIGRNIFAIVKHRLMNLNQPHSTSKIFFSQSSNTLGTKEFILNWFILACCLLFFFSANPPQFKRYTRVKEYMVPTGAVDFIENHNITGNIFNTYGYGGYLIYRLFPKQLVFIDGRADMYGDDFVDIYTKISSGSKEWQELFDPYGIDYILCRNTMPLRQLVLIRGDFKLVYEDKYHSVLLKDKPAFKQLIEKFTIKNEGKT